MSSINNQNIPPKKVAPSSFKIPSLPWSINYGLIESLSPWVDPRKFWAIFSTCKAPSHLSLEKAKPSYTPSHSKNTLAYLPPFLTLFYRTIQNRLEDPFGIVALTIPRLTQSEQNTIISNVPTRTFNQLGDPSDYQSSTSTDDIVKSCLTLMKNPPAIDRVDVIIHPIYPLAIPLQPELIDLSNCDLGLINISEKKAKQLILHCAEILSQPEKLLKLLQPIDKALSLELQNKGISFSEADDPAFLIAGPGLFILGPPQENAVFKSKGRVIDQVLLKAEQELGLNKQGSPIFIGFINSDQANSFIEEGNLFKEDESVSRLLIHGKNTHRLTILALIESLKGTQFQDIKPETLLKLLVRANISQQSAWTYLLDTNENIGRSPSSDPNTFNYNSRSPFVFNSLILCFGNHFDLPNLMCSMRDSFWKSAYEMVSQVQKNNPSSEKISKATIYTMIMKDLVNVGKLSNIGQDFSFTQASKEAALDPKYTPHPSNINGIKTKESDPKKNKQNMFTKMKNPLTLLYMFRNLPKYKELISEFLETQTTIKELALLGALFTSSCDLSSIFYESVKKRCTSNKDKLLFVNALVKGNSNDIAIKFIAAHFEILDQLIPILTDPQKEILLRKAISQGFIEVRNKIKSSGISIKNDFKSHRLTHLERPPKDLDL